MKLSFSTYVFLIFAFIIGCSKGNSGSNPTPVITVPASPTSLSATVASASQINLSWVDNSNNETGFTVERRTGAGSYSPIGYTLANSSVYNDIGVSPNTTYTYRVIAYNSAGNSAAYSNEVTVTSGGAVVLSTSIISAITTTTAVSGGVITSDGGLLITARGVVWSTSSSPTVALSTKTSDGTGTGTFISNISGLTPSTTYHVRAYATNAGGTGYGTEQTFTTTGSVITDIDGNTYQTLTYCTQTWIQKNLSVTHYRNGDPIPQISDPNLWSSSTTGAWCYVNNDPATEPIYGRLYNWKAATDPRGLAPTGWHVPSISDWHKLVKCLDPLADTTIIGTQSQIAGGAMKETGLVHWLSPNSGATNSTGFTGLPAGIRSNYPAIYFYIGQSGSFWSTTDQNPYESFYFILGNNTASSATTTFPPSVGMSIRCLKD